MTSLQARLSAGLILALALLTVLAVAVGGYSLRQMAEDFVAARLEHDLEAVLAALSFDTNGQPQLAADRIGANFRQPYSGHYYQIETARGELSSRSLWDADLTLPPLAPDRVTRAFITGPQEQRLLLVGRIFRVQDRPVAIAVTEDFTPVNAGLRRLLVELIVIAGVLFGALLWLQRLIVRRGLAPLEQVRRELPRLARGEIPQLSLEAPAEVRPLVAELNRLLDLAADRPDSTRRATPAARRCHRLVAGFAPATPAHPCPDRARTQTGAHRGRWSARPAGVARPGGSRSDRDPAPHSPRPGTGHRSPDSAGQRVRRRPRRPAGTIGQPVG